MEKQLQLHSTCICGGAATLVTSMELLFLQWRSNFSLLPGITVFALKKKLQFSPENYCFCSREATSASFIELLFLQWKNNFSFLHRITVFAVGKQLQLLAFVVEK